MSDYSTATIQQKRSLADIVREKTNDGETIVQFYLDVASGELDGFRDHHRMAAANKIGKIAPGLVDEYLLRYRNSDVRESLRGQGLLPVRRPPIKWVGPEDRETVPRGPNPFQRRLARVVRQETGDCRAIVVFVVGVMHGEIPGFKPHHRLEAADTLAGYVTHGESDAGRTEPGPIVVPAKAGTQRGGEGRRSEGAAERAEAPVLSKDEAPVEGPVANPIVVPAKAGTQRGGEGRRSHPGSPEPVLSADEEPSEALQVESSPTKSFPPITLEELERYNYHSGHFARHMFARDEITGGIYAFDWLGPAVADEDGNLHSISPDEIIGYERVIHAFRNRDRWPDDVPKPYEDFSSSPPPLRRSRGPIKIWV